MLIVLFFKKLKARSTGYIRRLPDEKGRSPQDFRLRSARRDHRRVLAIKRLGNLSTNHKTVLRTVIEKIVG